MSGELFQLHVQSYYMNSKQFLTFGVNFRVHITTKHYFYDCLSTLQELIFCKECRSSILCHFLQPNHFAFDSMVYDGNTQNLILIKITIDKNHKIHYDKIVSFIKNQKIQLKIGEKSGFFKKYELFFKLLIELKLVKTYTFQWMTNEKFEELINKSKKKIAKFSNDDQKLLQIFTFDINLINEINRATMFPPSE